MGSTALLVEPAKLGLTKHENTAEDQGLDAVRVLLSVGQAKGDEEKKKGECGLVSALRFFKRGLVLLFWFLTPFKWHLFFLWSSIKTILFMVRNSFSKIWVTTSELLPSSLFHNPCQISIVGGRY